MLRIKLMLSGILLFCGSSIFAQSKKDFQIWNYNTLYGQLNKHVDLFTSVEFRYRDNGTTFYYNHEHIELPIHVCSFIDIGPAYRQVFRLPSSSSTQWVTSYQPNFNLTFLWKIWGLHFADRSRITEIIEGSNVRDAWQYRNKLSVYKVLKKGPNEIRLFADDEIFFHQYENGIRQNRTSIGLNIGLFKKIWVDIGYRYRILKLINGWERNNILMLNAYAYF
jgi:hypothetical protein